MRLKNHVLIPFIFLILMFIFYLFSIEFYKNKLFIDFVSQQKELPDVFDDNEQQSSEMLCKANENICQHYHNGNDDEADEETYWWIDSSKKCASILHSSTTSSPSISSSSSSFIISPSQSRLRDALAVCQSNFCQKEINYRNKNRESCPAYLQRRHFQLKSFSIEEAKFPLAYSLIVYRDYPQVEQLLQTIYRPEHTICIHVDEKISSTSTFWLAINNLIDCFPDESIFLSTSRISIEWGTFSVLQADLICMKDLLAMKSKRNWLYFINLTGQEFPLRTNLELIKILKLFNGTNSVEGTRKRILNKFLPPPLIDRFQTQWYKGSLHAVLSAGFVKFALENEQANTILNTLQNFENGIPDELFFSTLNHNPQLGAPGAYLLEGETHPIDYPFIARLKNWNMWPFEYPCRSGFIVRQVCIWGMADLPFIISRPELFVNKFHWNFENVALQCLREFYWNRTWEQKSTQHVNIDLSFYSSLSFVRYHQ